MKNIFYILIILLFLNSCLVEKTTTIKGVKSDGPPVNTNTSDQTYITTGAGKVLANSIDSMTEGVPGVLNAAQLIFSILPLFVDNDTNKNKRYKTTKKYVPALNNDEMINSNIENKVKYEDEKKIIELNQAKNENKNFKRNIKITKKINGFAKKGTIVNAYYNNTLIGSSVSDENGKWIIEMEYGKNNYDLKYKCWKDGPENVFQC